MVGQGLAVGGSWQGQWAWGTWGWWCSCIVWCHISTQEGAEWGLLTCDQAEVVIPAFLVAPMHVWKSHTGTARGVHTPLVFLALCVSHCEVV